MLEKALGNLFLKVLTPIRTAVRSSDGMARGYYKRGSGESTYRPKKPSDLSRRVMGQFFTDSSQVSIEGLGGDSLFAWVDVKCYSQSCSSKKAHKRKHEVIRHTNWFPELDKR